jgi:hypothetical protein
MPRGDVEVYLYLFFTLGIRWGWVVSAIDCFTPCTETQYPLYRRVVRPWSWFVWVWKISP